MNRRLIRFVSCLLVLASIGTDPAFTAGFEAFQTEALSTAGESAGRPFSESSGSAFRRWLSNRPGTPYYSEKREFLIGSSAVGIFTAEWFWISHELRTWTLQHPAGILGIYTVMGIGRVAVSTFIAYRMVRQSAPEFRFDWGRFWRFIRMSLEYGTPVSIFLILSYLLPVYVPWPWIRFLATTLIVIPLMQGVTFYVMYRLLEKKGPREAARAVHESSAKAFPVLTVLLGVDYFLATCFPNPLNIATMATLGGILYNLFLVLGEDSRPYQFINHLNNHWFFSWMNPYYDRVLRPLVYAKTWYGIAEGIARWALFGWAMALEGRRLGGAFGRAWIGVTVAAAFGLTVREILPWIRRGRPIVQAA